MKKNYIGIREARINLSRLIRDVRSGMEIIITDRGNPVAKLIPVNSSSLSVEERIRNYESCGLIESRPKTETPDALPFELPQEFYKRSIREERQDD
ncbi:MAG: type II toxin-antitoxin system Phd/YefM family antitoxin [Dethiobacteria bacterium]|nr:type II toxin-antitoxin system prevent-host-death family antitoxin [Bacillota bacterium]MDW7729611.1 type II toxin-antitoxin system prevent-host-death family antitoxin [Bacillota bacterium]